MHFLLHLGLPKDELKKLAIESIYPPLFGMIITNLTFFFYSQSIKQYQFNRWWSKRGNRLPSFLVQFFRESKESKNWPDRRARATRGEHGLDRGLQFFSIAKNRRKFKGPFLALPATIHFISCLRKQRIIQLIPKIGKKIEIKPSKIVIDRIVESNVKSKILFVAPVWHQVVVNIATVQCHKMKKWVNLR